MRKGLVPVLDEPLVKPSVAGEHLAVEEGSTVRQDEHGNRIRDPNQRDDEEGRVWRAEQLRKQRNQQPASVGGKHQTPAGPAASNSGKGCLRGTGRKELLCRQS